MNPEKARNLTNARREAEEEAIRRVENKIERYAKRGKESVLIAFKSNTWKAQRCYEEFKDRGFECNWEYTNGFRIKW